MQLTICQEANLKRSAGVAANHLRPLQAKTQIDLMISELATSTYDCDTISSGLTRLVQVEVGGQLCIGALYLKGTAILTIGLHMVYITRLSQPFPKTLSRSVYVCLCMWESLAHKHTVDMLWHTSTDSRLLANSASSCWPHSCMGYPGYPLMSHLSQQLIHKESIGD